MEPLYFFSAPLFVALLVLAPPFSWAAKSEAQDEPQIKGQIVLADGTSVAGATVEATQDCYQGGDAIETRKTVSAADGTFSLPAYEPRCSRYRLIGSKEGDFWLPTDELVPGSQFGPTPNERIVVDISSVPPPRPVLVLNARGGKVAIRVRDLATGRFVFADLVYEKPDQDNVLGASMPTGLDGSATVHLLTPGQYTVKVGSFTCGDSHEEWHATADGPKISVLVRPAIESNEVIEIDSRKIKILKDDHGKFSPDPASPNCSRQNSRRSTSGASRPNDSR